MYLGLLAGLTIPWLYKLTFVTGFGATQEKAVLVLSRLVSVVIFATGAAPGFLVREHVPKEMEEKLTFWTSLRTAMRNRPFALILTGYCVVLKLCGYQDNVTPSDATNTAMKLTFILIPSLTLFVAILIFRKYPITRQRAERTRALLAERLAAPSP